MIKTANHVYISLNKILSSRMISCTTKEKKYLTYLRATPNYDSCLWVVVDDSRRWVEASYLWEESVEKNIRACQKRWKEKNINMISIFNKPNIKYFLKAKHLEFPDHVWRAEGSIIRKVLIYKLTGKRPRRNSWQRWQDRINTHIIRMVDGTANMDTAMDHDEWRGVIEAAKVLNGP